MDEAGQSSLVARLASHGWLGSIVGPEGSGKSTLIEDLEAAVSAAGREVVWIRLNSESTPKQRDDAVRQIVQLGPTQCCFLDGGEVLGQLNWWQLSRRKKHLKGGVLATLHRRRFLPVIYATHTGMETCIQLAKQLAGKSWNDELRQVAINAFDAQKGNVREVFRECYHWCSLREG